MRLIEKTIKSMPMSRIYLDNAATTPIDPNVVAYISTAMKDLWGNPSSIYQEGRVARAAIEEARKTIANGINASIGEIFFTSGGTESNNMALKCAVRDLGVTRIISSPTEHHAVLHTLESLEKYQSTKIEMVGQDQCGRIKLDSLEQLLKASDAKTLVSLMFANNEIGTLLDLPAVSALCEQYGAYLHSDSVQGLGFYPIDVEATKVHYLSGSAHKFYGPKGVGFIYINNEAMLKPFIDGGAQERNMRGGTENLYGILGMAKAFSIALEEMDKRRAIVESVRNYFVDQVQERIPGVQFNGSPIGEGHYKIASVSFPPSDKADLLLFSLDIEGISASGGSACSSGADAGSHVINAIHPGSNRKTIRFSFSHHNTKEEADQVIAKLVQILEL